MMRELVFGVLLEIAYPFLITPASAQGQRCTERRLTTLLFGNGMFNEENDAKKSLKALKRALLEHLPTGESEKSWRFELAYNESESFLTQLFEVTAQRVGSDKARFWQMLSGLEVMPDRFQEAMIVKSHPGSLEASLAHEIGHAFTGVQEMGNKVMDNVIQNENPVRIELGLPPRVDYYNP
jgi:hypothetical protein